MAPDPLLQKRTVDPKAVQASLLDHNERETLSRPRARLLLKLYKTLQQRGEVATPNAMLRHLLAAARRQRRDQRG